MNVLNLIDKLCGIEILSDEEVALIELNNATNQGIRNMNQLLKEGKSYSKACDGLIKAFKDLEEEWDTTIKFRDENGEIHAISGFDYGALNEAMEHEDWHLVFE